MADKYCWYNTAETETLNVTDWTENAHVMVTYKYSRHCKIKQKASAP